MASHPRKDGAEQSDRLQSYTAKDYTEVVEFPVELVDRDGVVRRYSYEESLAVYHRRIQSAAWRYGDEELVRAEIGHCTRRIDQIKRSYMLRAESGGTSPATDPRAALGEGWGLLQRFYRKALERRRLEPPDELSLAIALVHDEPLQRIYHIALAAGRPGHLLYVFPFGAAGDGDPRAAFRAARAAYDRQPAGADVERLLHEHEGRDLGFLLCGASDLLDGLDNVARSEAPEGMADGGPGPNDRPMRRSPARQEWVAGLDALARGETDEALDRLRATVEKDPWNREAYVALLSLLDGKDQWTEADFWAAFAARHIPDDAFLRFRIGVQLARKGALDEAVRVFDEAAAMEPRTHHPLLFAAHVLLARGKDLRGALRRLQAAGLLNPSDDAVARARRAATTALRTRTAGWVVGALLATLGAGVGITTDTSPWPLALFGLTVFALSAPLTAWVMMRWIRREADRPDPSQP